MSKGAKIAGQTGGQAYGSYASYDQSSYSQQPQSSQGGYGQQQSQGKV